MQNGNRHDLPQGISEGRFVADNECQGKAPDEEDEHELEGSHLFTWSSTYDTDHENQKNITEDRSKNRSHRNPVAGTHNVRVGKPSIGCTGRVRSRPAFLI
jgi:hypothetical protein